MRDVNLKPMTDDLYNRIKANPKNYCYIDTNIDRLWWGNICSSYELSENFINEFKMYISDYSTTWWSISRYQKLSYEFIVENLEYIYVDNDKYELNLNNNPCFKKFSKAQQKTILNIKQMQK